MNVWYSEIIINRIRDYCLCTEKVSTNFEALICIVLNAFS